MSPHRTEVIDVHSKVPGAWITEEDTGDDGLGNVHPKINQFYVSGKYVQ